MPIHCFRHCHAESLHWPTIDKAFVDWLDSVMGTHLAPGEQQ